MSTRLVILGLLKDEPLHGYDLKRTIEEHMGDWTSIAFGSIYFALGKLADEGFVAKVATEKMGNRPSRSVYEITPEGRKEFLRLLRETWTGIERQSFSIDIALAFMSALPADEVATYLDERTSALEKVMHHLDSHETEQMAQPEVPRSARAIFEHTRVHVAAELSWTERIRKMVGRGELP